MTGYGSSYPACVGRVGDLLRRDKIKLYVDGYASRTGMELANYKHYSEERAKIMAAVIQKEGASVVMRRDGKDEYQITIVRTGKGVWSSAGNGPADKARFAVAYVKASE